MEPFYAELNKIAEAATSSYSATGYSLQRIYFEILAKNYQKNRSYCLGYEFFSIQIL